MIEILTYYYYIIVTFQLFLTINISNNDRKIENIGLDILMKYLLAKIQEGCLVHCG